MAATKTTPPSEKLVERVTLSKASEVSSTKVEMSS